MKKEIEIHATNGYEGMLLSDDSEQAKIRYQDDTWSERLGIQYDNGGNPFVDDTYNCYYLSEFMRV